ncbi:MAG: hypothetical protein ABI882_20845 [Acidobacteriota bacterium]
MTRSTKIAFAFLFVCSLGTPGILAQTRKGESSSTPRSEAPKTSSSQKGSSTQSASSPKQTQSQAKPSTGGAERELSPEQKRDASKVLFLTLSSSAGNPGSILAKGTFKLDLPDGITVKGLDVLFETQFSNGQTRRDNFSIGVDRRDVETTISLPVVSRPPFDCSVCLKIDDLPKDSALAVDLQCRLNNCPAPPPSSGGSKESIKAGGGVAKRSATPTAVSVRSSSNGVVFADPITVKVTITGRFSDAASRGDFTRVDSRTLTKFGAASLSK